MEEQHLEHPDTGTIQIAAAAADADTVHEEIVVVVVATLVQAFLTALAEDEDLRGQGADLALFLDPWGTCKSIIWKADQMGANMSVRMSMHPEN